MVGIPTRHHVVRAVNPLTTGDAARSDPAETILTLAVVLVALNVWKSQHTPELGNVGRDALLVIGLVAIGTVAPSVVTGVLWVALLLWILTNQPAVTGLVQNALGGIKFGA